MKVNNIEELTQLLTTGSYSILSTYRVLFEEINIIRHNLLEIFLKENKYEYIVLDGQWMGVVEKSFLIRDMCPEEAIIAAKMLDQQAVVCFHNGSNFLFSILFSGRSYLSRKGKGFEICNFQNNYSEIELADGNKVRFALDLKINFRLFPPLSLVHYSPKTNLDIIDPNFMNTSSVSSQECKRGTPDTKRSYYYIDGTDPENLVVSQALRKYKVYTIFAGEVYDIGKDSDNIYDRLYKESMKRNINPGIVNMEDVIFEVKKSGYTGFRNSKSTLPNVVALFYPQKVQVSFIS